MQFFTSTLIWFHITDTQTHRHTDTQTHRHTDTHTDTRTHARTHTHTHTHTHTSKIYFTWFCDVFSFQELLTCRSYMLIKFNKRTFFPWNVRNYDRSGMNKSNTHTLNNQRKITLERASYYEIKFERTSTILTAFPF